MKLTQEEKQIKIAESRGWKRCTPDAVPNRVWPCKSYITGVDGPAMFPPEGLEGMTGKIATVPPDYFNDLNALYGAWESLTDDQKTVFASHIRRLHEGMDIRVFAAFGQYGAECIGLTLNLWEAGA